MDLHAKIAAAERRYNREMRLALELLMDELTYGFSALKGGVRVDPRHLRPVELTFTHYDELPRR